MVTLKIKEFSIPEGWEEMLRIDNKDTLANALKCFGYRLPSRARKDDYVRVIHNLLKNEPECLLKPLSWDSLTIINTLVKGPSGSYVCRPKGPRFRDIQTCLLVATYTDEENHEEYYCITDDLREVLAPVIDEFMSGEHAGLHRILDPYIIGLTNLYGFCPVPLLNGYLRDFNLLGHVEGLDITEETAQYLVNASAMNYTRTVKAKSSTLPAPYTGSAEEIYYLPSAAISLDKQDITTFFFILKDDGLIHREYRKFKREEITDAGDINPDFNFPQAKALKTYLENEGLSPAAVRNRLTTFWLSGQVNANGKKDKLEFKSKNLQTLYDDFIFHIPIWTSHAYSESEMKDGTDNAESAIMEFLDDKQKELAEIEKNTPVKQVPVFTLHPNIRPEGNNDLAARFIPGNMVEITISLPNGWYFVCYLCNLADDISSDTEGNLYIYALWGHLFDFLYERYSDSYGHLDIPPHVVKKYKRICGFIHNTASEITRKHNTCLDNIAFDDKTDFHWTAYKCLPDINWGAVVVTEITKHPFLLDRILSFKDDCLAISRDILKSDAKSLNASFQEMLNQQNL